jgi:RNA-directed DNA polymerase
MNREQEGQQRPAKSAPVPSGDKQAEEDLWQCYKAERGVWTEPMLAALARGVKGNKWFSLIDKVASVRTLELAWAKVQSNAGSCGVDGITVGRFEKDSQSRLLAVNEHLKKGSYQPRPVKRVWIPKPGSAEQRPLGIPTVTDRVVQAALRMVIEPIFEKEFAPQSYGFRPGRGCKDALRRVDGLLKEGHLHVVDVDIKGYFDTIAHQRLMELVKERVADGRVLGLIEAFLKQGVLEEVTGLKEAKAGTPQGGVISPLLANVYLNPLDWKLVAKGREAVRYADDIVVLCRSAEEAAATLEELREWMAEAGLTLHPEKTRVVDMTVAGSHFDFLGYRFLRTRRGNLMKLVRPKSLAGLREALRPRTRRNSGRSLEAIVTDLNGTLRGWYGYFKHAHESELMKIDGWVRMRLRCILRKRAGQKGRGGGVTQQRWRNRYFAKHGLFCLMDAHVLEIAGLRGGGTC